MAKYKLEDDINDFVKIELQRLGLKKGTDWSQESSMSDYLKEALKGSAKTKNKTNFGKPDFSIEKYSSDKSKYKIPVLIENKRWLKKLKAMKDSTIKDDEKSIQAFAVNGAIHYATSVIGSGKYSEAIAIGIAGDNRENLTIEVYYVFGSNFSSCKFLEAYKTLDFLENENSFTAFYQDCVLSEDEKHNILIKSKADLSEKAKKLNKLMHNHSITAPQRVLYVSGMLLSMQDIPNIKDGLSPEDLKGSQGEKSRDSAVIFNQIEEYLNEKGIEQSKKELMLKSFSEISKDKQRDELTKLDKEVSKELNGEASVSKQIFAYIYYNIYLSIGAMQGHLDIMGELYSEFLKYALGDGKELGIVLTPPYVTKMMTQILDMDEHCRVMDLATGSAGFLISSMEEMITCAEERYGKNTSEAISAIKRIKEEQLLGIELNAEMFTLAATNMILRGDGSSKIQKANTFSTPKELYENFKANRLLLNPPFSFEENGMPFIAFGLEQMEVGGLAAIIIQDSAGSGKAIASNTQILKNHRLLASIKMPTDLFQPMAGVQTSIYIFRAWEKHDYEKTVKFIDFRSDGYKRTKRDLYEEDNPTERYADIIKIYKAGLNAKVSKDLWDLSEIYVEDFITDSGADWNFDQHKKINTTPRLEDFQATVKEYLAWKVAQVIQGKEKSSKKA